MNFAISKYPQHRKKVKIFHSAHGTTWVINYASDNNHLNTFLTLFDIWGAGQHKISYGNKYTEIWFEMPYEFMSFAESPMMQKAFSQFGVQVQFEEINSKDIQRSIIITSLLSDMIANENVGDLLLEDYPSIVNMALVKYDNDYINMPIREAMDIIIPECIKIYRKMRES